MKIVIVLCALVTFAIAVPVYQENVLESSLNNQASSTKRERKSALPEITPGLFADHGIEKIPIHSSKKSSQGTSLEAKSFRRPIIIKRKLGYHVYRDSDEEMAYAEPGEKCREQVKFKLCDHEPVSSSKNGFKSPTFKCLNSHNTDNEMENSIKMAKEAVVHLQKDLKRMENFSPKMVNPNIEDIESNTGLHHDIEIAREALEHIEQNFEVNKVNDLQIPKSQDKEKLTRWREAIENIHKNFEIVKNIEDAFKSDNHLPLFRSDSIKAVESEEPEHSEGQVLIQRKFTNDNLENNDEVYNEDKILKSASNEDGKVQLTPETENEDNIGKEAGNDMFVSPTENREEKVQLHSDSLKSEINYKDTSLRSDDSEIESTKHDTNVPRESIEYALKTYDSLSESNPESRNENSPLELISFMPKSTVIENSKNSEASGEDKKYSDKYNNKVIENKENKESYNTNMRLNNDQLEITEQLSADNFDTIDQDVIQSPHLFSLKEKNVFSGEENVQNEHKTHHTIKDSHEYDDSLKDSKLEVKDEAQNFKHTDEYKNMKSSEILDGQIGSIMSQNQELNKFSILNDDSLKTVDQKEPQLYKTVSAASNEHILNNKDKFANQYSTEEEMSMTITQNKDANEDPKWKFPKSDPELYSEIVDKSDDQHSYKSQESMRLSQTQTEKLQSNEYHEGAEQASTRFDIENSSDDIKSHFLKSVPELQPYPDASLPTDKEDNTNDQQSHGEEASMRSSENQNEKMQSNEYQEVHEPLPIGLDIERHPEENTWKFPKSVPELPFDLMVSMPQEKVDITDNQHAHKEEVSMRSSENQNEKKIFNENQEVHEPLPNRLNIERHPEERTWQLSKSVPELPLDTMASIPTEKVDITDDQHAHKEEVSMRSSENQNEKKIFNENQEVHEPLPKGLDIERHPEERTWQLSKSVPELPLDPMALLPTEKVDITDEKHAQGEESIRMAENQNDKMQSNENQEVREPLSTGLDIERHPEGRSWQHSKSVPELQLYPIASLPLDKVDITNDQQAPSQEASMKSAEKTNEEKIDEIQEIPLPMGLDFERQPEEHTWQLSKSVPELSYDPMVSMLSNKFDITDDHQSHREEASMRSSENQNENMQTNYNQEVYEPLPIGLDIERHPEDRKWQLSKSVPDLHYDPMESMPSEKVDITDDQHFHNGQGSMRMSHAQNEKLQLKNYQEGPDHASTRLDIENNSDDTKTQVFKSVPEDESHPIASFPSDDVETTNNRHLQREEASMRSAGGQNDKNLLNENQEVHQSLPTKLDNERHPEERTWQYSKSVPEMPYESMVSMHMEKIDITDDQHSHKGETRSSESESEKLQLNKKQEDSEHASTILNIENNSDDSESQFFKSVPELPLYSIASLPSDKVDITNDQQSYKEEASMRSSENQNEKMQSNEYQEVHEPLPMGTDIERHPDERTLQYSKSVPELPFDSIVSMPKEKVELTDNQHAPKGEESMRSSENQNEKILLNIYQNDPEYASTRLNIENNSDDTKTHLWKSVSEQQPMTTDKVETTDDQQSHKEEVSMRSSETQNEKMQSNENQEVHEPLPMVLDRERDPEGHTWQYSKSVPELSYDPIVSRPTEQVDITDDHYAHKGEENMRMSENDKMQSNENQELHTLLSGLDIERHPEDQTWQLSKSVPELSYDAMISMPTEKVYITDDQHVHKGEERMRSLENQNDKMQSKENQEAYEERSWQYSKSVPELQLSPIASLPLDKVDIPNDQQSPSEEASMRSAENPNEKNKLDETQEVHEPLTLGSDAERQPEESIWQYSKAVPELPYDSMVSMTTEKVDITDDQYSYKGDASMRVPETQNEKFQLNDYKEEPEHLPTRFNIENNVENQNSNFFKSVPELHSDPLVALPTDKVDINNDQYSDKEKAGMKLTQAQNEKLQLHEIQETHEPLIMRLDMTNNPEDRKWQFSKSVPELPNDPMVSMPTDRVEIFNQQKSLNEGNMRLSQNQNERTQFHESHGLQEFYPTNLGIENHPEYSTSQFYKSAPELYMTRSNINHANNENFYIPEDARLSQNQNERHQIYFNQHHYEPLSSRLDNEKNIEDDSLHANKARFSYMQNPMNEQTNMRLSQNQNENKDIQYPSTSFGLGNEHMNRDDNVEHNKNDNMHLSVAQHQQLHENRNSVLRSSNERQYLNPNYNSRPEYKMLPSKAQFEFRNGQNLFNEHTNMRINEQSRDPEPMENQNLHNSLSMLWNTENQHQDASPKTFKSNSDYDHTLHKSNEFDNEQFIPHEASKPGNTLEYRTRPQLFGDHILDDTQSSRWYQAKQHNDHFANYYKTIPEAHEEYMNPNFRKHLHRVAVNHKLNDADTFSSYDFPSSRLHDHMQKYHQEKSSNIDSSMEPNMHMNMREREFAKSGTEFNNMHFNHPHSTARFGAGLPIAGVNPGAVGVFPTANAGCGIPLMLSCSPSVVSGSLARQHIAGPVFKSVDENFKYYMKRDAKNIGDVPDIKIQKTSFPHHATGAISEI